MSMSEKLLYVYFGITLGVPTIAQLILVILYSRKHN